MDHHSNQKRAESFPLHALGPEGLWLPPFQLLLALLLGQETSLATTISRPSSAWKGRAVLIPAGWWQSVSRLVIAAPSASPRSQRASGAVRGKGLGRAGGRADGSPGEGRWLNARLENPFP